MRSKFDVVNARLKGRKLIEASAGTGKTYSLIHIVARLIVEENIPIERLLLVTFTKAATAELKMRVRELLVKAYEAYTESKEDDPRYDPTLLKLVTKWRGLHINPSVFREAIDRLDDASICTIHSFCQKMLEEHKFSSSEGFDFEIADDSDLRQEVIEHFLREQLSCTDSNDLKKVLIDHQPWESILKALSATPKESKWRLFKDLLFVDPKTGKHDKKAWKATPEQIALEESVRKLLLQFIEWAPAELKRRKRESDLRSFDDLLIDMYEELNNTAFVQRVQSRYDAVLIDEFQDTDPVQYTIFKRLFLDPSGPAKAVYFVGDPKQSIYRFRNADLNTYLAAQDDIGEICELKANYRSCPELLSGINQYFSQAQEAFLDTGIHYSPITPGAQKTPLLIKKGENFEHLPAFELWTRFESNLNPEGNRNHQAQMIANEIAVLLSGNVYKNEKDKLRPGDIAVLVRHKTNVPLLIDALAKKGIRVLFQDESNIFATEEAREMLRIIEAIESPQDIRAIRQARATRLMGESINDIVPEAFENNGNETISDKASLRARELIEEAGRIWTKRGFAASIAKIMLECATQKRLLPVLNGERCLANYQQLIELLQQASQSLKGISGLARWLKQQIASPRDDDGYRLRLDSDADLVNVMTIHKSKGLEYPVIFALFANELVTNNSWHFRTCVFKEIVKGQIVYNISFIKLNPDVLESINHENDLENLRLAYVAMTRASQRLVLPLPYYKSRKELVGFRNAFTQILTGSASPQPDSVVQAFKNLQKKASDGMLFKSISDEPEAPSWAMEATLHDNSVNNNDHLEAAKAQVIPTSWFPTSYTAIARGAAETTESLTLMQEKEDSGDEDWSEVAELEKNVAPRDNQSLTIMDFERGLESGTFLHSLFERIDFNVVKQANNASPEAENTLNQTLKRLMTPFQYHLQPQGLEGYLPVFNRLMKDVLCSSIVAKSVFDTEKDLRLCEITNDRKTPEMNFTIAIGEPSEGRLPVTAKNLTLLLEHFDPIYHLQIENDKELRGYLTGAIDLAFECEGKYFVLDWKGTKLADRPEGFTAERILKEIDRHHYSLQYLIYLVALRRHLRFCGVADPDTKIGGAIYAFIRGIRREDAQPYGVFTAQPPRALIACLDEFFEKGYHEGAVRAFAQTSLLEGSF